MLAFFLVGRLKSCEMCGTAAPASANPERKAQEAQFKGNFRDSGGNLADSLQSVDLLKLTPNVARERVHFDATSWKIFKLLATQLGISVPKLNKDKESKENKDSKPEETKLSDELCSMIEVHHLAMSSIHF